MRSGMVHRRLALAMTALGLVCLAPSAFSQAWTQVPGIPTTELFSLFANADTIAAGADTAVYVSTDGGTTWKRSSKPVAGVKDMSALWIRDGILYAGTFGQGVFVSGDLGATWSAFNQGLTGGFLDSQLDVVDLVARGDSLYVGTAGAGVYVRRFTAPSSWSPLGTVFEPNQAPNVNSLALGGTRILAQAGANGMEFVNDPGDADWAISNLDNVGVHAGLEAMQAKFTGTAWVVGTNLGVFRSATGEEPWARTDPGFGPLSWTAFAMQGQHMFAAFSTLTDAFIEESDDNGATFQNEQDFSATFIQDLAVVGSNVYAARNDGLFVLPLRTLSVAGTGATGLHFAVAGPQPSRANARLRFDLPRGGSASIELFDVHGRLVGERVQGTWSAGPQEISLDTARLSAGVYQALLTADGAREVVRLVHLR